MLASLHLSMVLHLQVTHNGASKTTKAQQSTQIWPHQLVLPQSTKAYGKILKINLHMRLSLRTTERRTEEGIGLKAGNHGKTVLSKLCSTRHSMVSQPTKSSLISTGHTRMPEVLHSRPRLRSAQMRTATILQMSLVFLLQPTPSKTSDLKSLLRLSPHQSPHQSPHHAKATTAQVVILVPSVS